MTYMVGSVFVLIIFGLFALYLKTRKSTPATVAPVSAVAVPVVAQARVATTAAIGVPPSQPLQSISITPTRPNRPSRSPVSFPDPEEGGALSVNNSVLPSSYEGTPEIGGFFHASGGKKPYTWRMDNSEMPPGLVLNSDGTISGTPTKEDLYTFSVIVTSADGQMAQAGVGWTVGPPLNTPSDMGAWIGFGDANYVYPQPVRVMAGVTCPRPIVAVTLYLDGKIWWTDSVSSVDMLVTLEPGDHILLVRFWDNTGQTVWQWITITIGTAPPA